MKTKFILSLLIGLAYCGLRSQNLSTGIDNFGNALPIGATDPNWIIASSPLLPLTNAQVCTFYAGFWEPTPVAGTNAGWINFSGDPYGGSIGGLYIFERPFSISNGISGFVCNFSATSDDALDSLQLVAPDQSTITVAIPYLAPYNLGPLAGYTVTNPMPGIWKVRAFCNFVDAAAGFLLSGHIDTLIGGAPLPCCDGNILRNGDFEDGYYSSIGDGGSFNGCGSAFPASYATDWCGVGTPQYVLFGGANNYGITLWGIGQTFQTGEAFYQNVSIVAGSTYQTRFDGIFRDINPTAPDSIIFKFWASNTAPTSVNDPAGVLIGEYVVKNTNWGTYELPLWTAPNAYQYAYVSIHNGSLVNDGMYACWGGIDNICITPDTLVIGEVLPCCNSNLVANADFEDGYHSNTGDGGSFTGCNSAFPNSYATNWCGVGTPQYIQYATTNNYGITMWGIGQNFQAGEGFYQAMPIGSSGNICTYNLRFDGLFRDINPNSPDSIVFKFWAYNIAPNTVNAPGGVLIGEYSVKNTSWGRYTLPEWTTTNTYQYLFVSIHNSSLVNDGAYACWGGIDNICLQNTACLVGITDGDGMAAEPILFPNPAGEKLTLRAATDAAEIASVEVVDLLGRTFVAPFISVSAREVQVDISRIPAGSYVLRVQYQDGSQVVVKKFVKL